MTDRVRYGVLLAALLGFGAVVFLAGINWGLPSRRADPFLFGEHPIWMGAEIYRLAESGDGAHGPAQGWEDPNRASDVGRTAGAAGRAMVVNATDAQRAQIVRRYRLYSYQPDEMLTLMALARMKPGQGDFDPRMYQYGGLWIYPVGAMLKAASLLHIIELKGGPAGAAYYIDHPEMFGRFYVIARLYVVFWGLVGVWAVFAIVRRICGGLAVPAMAAGVFVLMPVVVNAAHEAKPHLPGAVLVLLAVLSAARYVETGSRRAWVLAGALCGAAVGMVLSMLPALLILPLMVLLRASRWKGRLRVLAGALCVAIAVYAMTNPYVIYHLFRQRGVLVSNLSNLSQTQAIFGAGRPDDGVANAVALLLEGMSPLLMAVGIVGAIGLALRAVRVRAAQNEGERSRRAHGLLLAAPALVVLAVFVPLATDKTGEFGRFFLLPAIFFAIEAVVALATFVGAGLRRHVWSGAILLTTFIAGGLYVRAFVKDSSPDTSRLREAKRLAAAHHRGVAELLLPADPAPYCLPPVDLFTFRLVKIPSTGFDVSGGAARMPLALLEPIEVAPPVPGENPLERVWKAFSSTRISWANKRFLLIFPKASPRIAHSAPGRHAVS